MHFTEDEIKAFIKDDSLDDYLSALNDRTSSTSTSAKWMIKTIECCEEEIECRKEKNYLDEQRQKEQRQPPLKKSKYGNSRDIMLNEETHSRNAHTEQNRTSGQLSIDQGIQRSGRIETRHLNRVIEANSPNKDNDSVYDEGEGSSSCIGIADENLRSDKNNDTSESNTDSYDSDEFIVSEKKRDEDIARDRRMEKNMQEMRHKTEQKELKKKVIEMEKELKTRHEKEDKELEMKHEK